MHPPKADVASTQLQSALTVPILYHRFPTGGTYIAVVSSLLYGDFYSELKLRAALKDPGVTVKSADRFMVKNVKLTKSYRCVGEHLSAG